MRKFATARRAASQTALWPSARFLYARLLVGGVIALLVLVRGVPGGTLPVGALATGLMAWFGLTSLAAVLASALRRWPAVTRGLLLCGDTIATATAVRATGGTGGPTLVLIALPILAGGFLLRWRMGLFLGLLAAFCYQLLALGETGAATGAGAFWPGIAIHGGSFVAIGLAAGYLGLRAARDQRDAAETRVELAAVRLSTDRILASLTCGLIAVDATGAVGMVNRAARQMLDLGESPGTGGDSLRARHARLGSLLRATLARGQGEQDQELQLAGRDGTFPAWIKTAAIVDDSGRRQGALALVWDLTERKRLEDAARRAEHLAAIGELSAGLAHEIRNSLKPITGCIELLGKRELLVADAGPMMEVITREADSLEAFLSQFLALARDKSMKFEEVDLEDLIGHEIRALSVADSAVAARVTLRCQGAGTLWGDRDWLRLVFRNLILNALEADGQGRVRVELEPLTRGEAVWLRARVTDEGPGFATLSFREAFRPFETGKPAGTGLGLPIALRGVQEHGGRIWLDPAVRGGASICVELPVAGRARQGRDRGDLAFDQDAA